MLRAARANSRLRVRIVMILLVRSVTNSTRLVSRLTRDGVSVCRVVGAIRGMEVGLEQ
jgi:hypothetical protein